MLWHELDSIVVNHLLACHRIILGSFIKILQKNYHFGNFNTSLICFHEAILKQKYQGKVELNDIGGNHLTCFQQVFCIQFQVFKAFQATRSDPFLRHCSFVLSTQYSQHCSGVWMNAMYVWSCDRVPICEYGFSRPWVCGFNKFDTADNMLRTCFRIQHETLVHYMKSRIAHQYPDHFVCKTCCLCSLNMYSSQLCLQQLLRWYPLIYIVVVTNMSSVYFPFLVPSILIILDRQVLYHR